METFASHKHHLLPLLVVKTKTHLRTETKGAANDQIGSLQYTIETQL